MSASSARGEFWILERFLTEGYPGADNNNPDGHAAVRADLNRVNNVGYTPLALAIRYGHWKTIDLLLKNKAVIAPGTGNDLLEGTTPCSAVAVPACHLCRMRHNVGSSRAFPIVDACVCGAKVASAYRIVCAAFVCGA